MKVYVGSKEDLFEHSDDIDEHLEIFLIKLQIKITICLLWKQD